MALLLGLTKVFIKRSDCYMNCVQFLVHSVKCLPERDAQKILAPRSFATTFIPQQHIHDTHMNMSAYNDPTFKSVWPASWLPVGEREPPINISVKTIIDKNLVLSSSTLTQANLTTSRLNLIQTCLTWKIHPSRDVLWLWDKIKFRTAPWGDTYTSSDSIQTQWNNWAKNTVTTLSTLLTGRNPKRTTRTLNPIRKTTPWWCATSLLPWRSQASGYWRRPGSRVSDGRRWAGKINSHVLRHPRMGLPNVCLEQVRTIKLRSKLKLRLPLLATVS